MCFAGMNAVVALWCSTGCSKHSVASALTYFPPDPPLYSIEKYDSEGNLVVSSRHLTNGSNGDINHSSSDEQRRQQQDQSPGQMIMERHSQFVRTEKRNQSFYEKSSKDDENERAIQYKFIPHPSCKASHANVQVDTVKLESCDLAINVYRAKNNHKGANKVILFSHGNATDIGGSHPFATILCKSTCCTVVTYDYSGYGVSAGYPNVPNTFKNINAVYKYCVKVAKELNPEPDCSSDATDSNVILYGQSVGSGPSTWLAAKLSKRRKIKPSGLILHSPFMSGIRVLTNQSKVPCCITCLDVYQNYELIDKVQVPVFFLHGKKDEEIDISHSMEMYHRVPDEYKYQPWWVPNRGHNDIHQGVAGMTEYLIKINQYLDSLS